MHGNRDRLIADLANQLLASTETGDMTRLLDPAVFSLADELAGTLADDSADAAAPDVLQARALLVAVHWARYQFLPEGEDQEDLNACLRMSAMLLLVAPQLVPEPIRAYLAGPDESLGHSTASVGNRGVGLYLEYRRTGGAEFLQNAINCLHEAANATPAGDPDRPGVLSNLGSALRSRFERTGQQGDLDQAITYQREALDASPVGNADRPIYLSNMGNALASRFECTGRQADLDQAIAYQREAAETTPLGHPDRPRYLSSLGANMGMRFERTGQQSDLDQAITYQREAAESNPVGHPERAAYLSNLGNALRIRFERTGQQSDLNQAIAAGREVIEATPISHPSRPGRLTNLGNAAQARFRHNGQQADLDQAISIRREAAGITPLGHPDRPRHLSNFASTLYDRFERTGQQADLDQAIAHLLEAASTTPRDHPARPGYLSNLGGIFQARFRRTGQQADLDQAISICREAVETSPNGHPRRAGYLSNLGNALQDRFERTGQQADLGQAITYFREAAGTIPSGHPERAIYLSNLGNALLVRFARTAQQADLDQGIATVRESIDATPVDHPNRPRRLSNLGNALATRFDRTGQRADLNEALEVLREGTGVPTASPGSRIAAARRWGKCAMLAGRPETAVEGYTAAIGLLPLAAWHGLDQPTREHHLKEWAGLASDAAAAAVVAGQPARAVELLEAGRSVLWTQARHLREDLSVLQERAPDLAAALERARTILDTSPDATHGLDTADAVQVQAAEQQMLDDRRQAARDWDAAVGEIRCIAGFEHFLLAVPFTDLRAAATNGPVVIVNISGHGSHALIVTAPSGPEHRPAVVVVDLPEASTSTVIDQGNTLLTILNRASDPESGWRTRENDRRAVFEILSWSWHSICEPVLTTLGYTRTPQGKIEDMPRIWWCPTGPATMLPLHAAGRHPRTLAQHTAIGEAVAVANTVAGRVISSYAQTLTALAQARSRPAVRQVRQLAVGMAKPPSYVPGAHSLPAVSAEFRVVASYLPEPEHATHLLGPAATQQGVLEALPTHSWLHLSCHGFQHPVDASLSAFLLHDQPLTLADLAALNLHDTELAYLAACQTATGDTQLLDEALHLAGALQLAGYRHVLATLWSISDTDAPAMADVIYAHLLHTDPGHPNPTDLPQADRTPYALNHAVSRLRRAHPGEPLLWAPYIHYGP
jgi:tetratricopeptide (TPR) repeat protein